MIIFLKLLDTFFVQEVSVMAIINFKLQKLSKNTLKPPYSSAPIGLEDVSHYPDLFNLLQQKDPARWTDENLRKLAGLNLIRVFKEAEKASI